MKKFLTLLILFIFIQSCDDKKTQQFGGVNLTIQKQTYEESSEVENEVDVEVKLDEDDFELTPLKNKEVQTNVINSDDVFRSFRIRNENDLDNNLNIETSENQIADIDAVRVTLNNGQPTTVPIINGSASYSRDGLAVSVIPIKVDLLGGGLEKYTQTKSVSIVANQNASVSFNSFFIMNQQISITNSSFGNTVVQGDQISFDWTNTHAEQPVQIAVIQNNDTNIIQTLESSYIGTSYVLNTTNSNPTNNIGFKVISNVASNTSSSICCFDLVANAPEANDVSSTVNEDSSVTIQLDGSSPGGESVTYSIVSNPSNGSLSGISGSNVTYTPNQDYNGSDSFTYRANNGSQDSNIATVTISVISVNDAPVANNISAETNHNEAVDLQFNASDIDGDNLSYFIVSGASNGTLTLHSSNQVEYLPNSGFSGNDSFTYGATDGNISSNTATATVVVAANIEITYPNGGETLNHDDTVTITWNNGWSDTHIDLYKSGQLVYRIADSIGNVNSFNWTIPSSVGTGDDYRVRVLGPHSPPIGYDESDNTFSILDSSGNTAPTVEDISISTSFEQSVSINLLGSDADNDNLTYFVDTNPINGTVAFNGSSTIIYTPNSDFSGNDSFTYYVNDGLVDSNIATVSITTSKVNITYPVGGESLIIGAQYQLTWDGGFTNTGIELWNGEQKIVDINGDVGTANSFAWTIPSNISTGDGFFIKIYDAGTGTNFVDSNNFSIVGGSDFTFTYPNGGDQEFVIGGSSESLGWTNTNGSVKLSLQVDENYDLSGANAGWNNASWSTLWSQDGVGSGFNYTAPSPDLYFSSGNNEHHDLMNTTQENHGRYRFTIENGSGFGFTDDFVFKRSESGTYASNNSLYFDDVSTHGYADFREIMHSFGKPDYKATVSFWVKNTGDWRDSGDSGVFLANQLSDNSNTPRALRIGVSNNSPHKPYIYFYGPNVNINSTGSTTLQKDVWYHFVATIDNTNGKFILYLNGNEEINFDFTPTDFTTQIERLWQLNGFSWEPNHHTLQAYYDDFAVWRTVLSESEISQLYNSGDSMDASAVQNSDLVAYYPFESLDSFGGSHQKTYDISPFRKHGYVYGGVLSSDDPNSNRAPTTNDISVSIDENRIMDRKIGITLEGNDADEDALTYSLVTTPINGTQSINGNILTYNANQDWNGVETFTYKANDGESDSNISTITITVNPVNDNPVVTTNDCCVSLSGEHDYVNLGSNIDFSNNFSIFTKMRINSLDPDNGDGSIISAGVGSQNQGFYFYIEDNNGTPRLGLSFYGQESILDDTIDLSNYIGDGLFHTYATTFNATTKEAKLFIDGQSLVSGNFSTLFGNNNTDVYIGLTPWNSADDMNAFVDYTAIWDGAMGEQEVNELHNGQKNPLDISNGLVGYWDFDSVSTSFNDLSGNSNTASYATNGSEGTGTSIDVATNEDVNLTIDLSPYVTDVDNDQLTYNISTQSSNGSLAVNNSQITYSPNLNYFGTDSFKWYVNDGVVDSDTVGVSINILSINDAPVTTNQSATAVTNQALDITLTSTDIESDSITYSIVSDVSNGSTSLNGSVVTYTPNSNFSGSDSFTFKANDGTDDSNTSTVTITVNNRSTKSVEISSPSSVSGNSYQVYPLNFDVNGKVVHISATVSLNGNSSSHLRYMNLLLTSPNQSRVLLMGGDQLSTECSQAGECIDSNSGTLTSTSFNSDATTFIYDGSAPYIGSFKPNESLNTFVDEEINGEWQLHILNSSGSSINVSNIKFDITYDADTGGTTYTEENNFVFSTSDQTELTVSGNSTGILSIPVSLPAGKGIKDLDFELSLNGNSSSHLRYISVTVDIGNSNNAMLVFRGDQISGSGDSYDINYNNMYKARFDDETTNEYTNSLMHAQRVEADTNSGGLDAFDGQTLTEFRIYIYNGSGSSLDISKSNTKVYIDVTD